MMPQITTAFASDFATTTTMRWALDAASDRVPVPSRTPVTNGSAHRQIGARRHHGRKPARRGGGGRRLGARTVALLSRSSLGR
jgi:hypothetical protein